MIQPSKPNYQTDFGGTKVDYAPVFDPSTDRSATQINSVFAATSGLIQVSPIAMYRFDFNSSTNTFIITKNLSFIGNGFETITYISTGQYTFRMYKQVYDFLNNVQTIVPIAITIFNNANITLSNSPLVLCGSISASGTDANGAYTDYSITCKNLTSANTNPTSFLLMVY